MTPRSASATTTGDLSLPTGRAHCAAGERELAAERPPRGLVPERRSGPSNPPDTSGRSLGSSLPPRAILAPEAVEDRLHAAVAELAAALVEVARTEARPDEPGPVEMIGVNEFARRAGIGRSSAWLAVGSGRVRSAKVGGRRVVPISELVRLAEGPA